MAQPPNNSANPPLSESGGTDQGANNLFKMYDEENKSEVDLAKAWNQELNRIASAPVTIYLLLDTTIDELYGEDKNSQYSAPIPNVIGHYSPQPIKFELLKWGIDSDIELVIIFTKDELERKIGRMMQHGDLIYDKDKRLFEVTEVYDDANFQFEWVSQYVMCKRKLGDTTILLGDYDNPNEGAARDYPPENAGDLPPSPGKTKEEIRYDDLYDERVDPS